MRRGERQQGRSVLPGPEPFMLRGDAKGGALEVIVRCSFFAYQWKEVMGKMDQKVEKYQKL